MPLTERHGSCNLESIMGESLAAAAKNLRLSDKFSTRSGSMKSLLKVWNASPGLDSIKFDEAGEMEIGCRDQTGRIHEVLEALGKLSV